MSLKDNLLNRLKKQAITDSAILLLIFSIIALFVWFSGRSMPGWDITDEVVVLENEDRSVQSEIYVREDASLELDNSTLEIVSRFDHDYSLYLLGEASLSMKDSRIEGDEYLYLVSAEPVENKSPTLSISGSKITDHSGIRLYGRTSLSASDSEIGVLQLLDNSRANLTDTSVYPVFFFDEPESLTGLTTGSEITMELESETGWELSMENCTVFGYQLEIFGDTGLNLNDSDGITLSFHSPGDAGEKVEADLGFIFNGKSGSTELFGSDVTWENVSINRSNFYVMGSDEVQINGGMLGEFYAFGESELVITGSQIDCRVCGTFGSSYMKLEGVTMEVDGNENSRAQRLTVQDTSTVEISDSDISNLEIVVFDLGKLIIRDSVYDENLIRVVGEGEVVYEQ